MMRITSGTPTGRLPLAGTVQVCLDAALEKARTRTDTRADGKRILKEPSLAGIRADRNAVGIGNCEIQSELLHI